MTHAATSLRQQTIDALDAVMKQGQLDYWFPVLVSALENMPRGTFADEITWQRDHSDIISAHDGVNCIVDGLGLRWKRTVGSSREPVCGL